MNTPQATEKQDIFALKDPFVLLGIFMFFVNRFSDQNLNLPVGDLIFPLLTFFFASKQNLLNRFFHCPGAILALLLMCVITLSNVFHNVPISHQARQGYAIITLFLPVFFFILTDNRKAMMSYIIGTIVGFGVYFLVMSGLSIVNEGTISRGLRGDQPTPAVALALFFAFRKQLTTPLKYALLFPVITSGVISIIIEARGPLLSLIIAGGLFMVANTLPRPRFMLALSLTVALFAHFIWGLTAGSVFDVVASSHSDTLSNLQRAYAIDYCRMILSYYPWLGDSPLTYAESFADNFLRVAGFVQPGDGIKSPHNSFLEYAVFFGYPAGVLFVATMVRIVWGGLNNNTVARTLFAALAVASVIRMGAFYGFSGWLRLEWFAVIFPLYYLYAQNLRPGSQRRL